MLSYKANMPILYISIAMQLVVLNQVVYKNLLEEPL